MQPRFYNWNDHVLELLTEIRDNGSLSLSQPNGNAQPEQIIQITFTDGQPDNSIAANVGNNVFRVSHNLNKVVRMQILWIVDEDNAAEAIASKRIINPNAVEVGVPRQGKFILRLW